MLGVGRGTLKGLVVGGAGGIGRWIVERMVRAGYEVTIADINPQQSAEVAQRTGAIRWVTADITTELGAQRAVAVARDGGELHAVVNSGGISPKKEGKKRPFHEIELDEWNRVLAVNLTGPFLVMREAYPHLARHDNASIVNLVSIMGKAGTSGPDGTRYGLLSPSGAHYAASKAALANLIASASRELAPLGIRCNGVSPGYVGSGMGGSTAEDVNRAIIPQIPLGRAAEPDEVAGVVAFLLGRDAGYITGEVIDIDGGWMPD